jgi:hypothetical protein
MPEFPSRPPFNRLCHTPYPLARLRVARLPSRRSGLTALWMGGSPSHPLSSHLPTSLRAIKFQGQRAAFGSPGQWSPNTVFYSWWKLTPPFSGAFHHHRGLFFSAHPLISSPAINSECYSHSLTSSSRSIYITYSHL